MKSVSDEARAKLKENNKEKAKTNKLANQIEDIFKEAFEQWEDFRGFEPL